MPSENNTPAIRFAGFTGEWEKRKLGDCFTERQERSEIGELISVTIHDGIKKFEELGRHDTSSEDKSHYKCVEVGDIAYNSMRMWQGACGYSPYRGILSPAYTVIIPQNGISSKFFSYSFKRPDIIHVFQLCSQGITSDTWNLKFPAFSEIEAIVPEWHEQQKIAIFFESLDTLITLHRRKCELLEALKKSMLEKLFPKEGELVPELRFAGFTGEWEPLKLEELCVKTTGGGTPSTSMTAYWNGEIPWFQSSDFKDGVVSVSSSNKHISPAGLQKSAAHLIPANSIAIVTRVGFGKLALIPFEYTTSQDLLSLSYLGVDPLFGVYSIYKKLQSELMAVQGTSIKGITKEDLLAKDVLTSRDQDEQQKIGVFLSRIDTLLTLHRCKLELLQNIKKACLEKMFV